MFKLAISPERIFKVTQKALKSKKKVSVERLQTLRSKAIDKADLQGWTMEEILAGKPEGLPTPLKQLGFKSMGKKKEP